MTFASVYPMYLAKVEKKGRTKEELHQVIKWLTSREALLLWTTCKYGRAAKAAKMKTAKPD